MLVRPFFTDWAAAARSAPARCRPQPAPIESLIAHFGGGWVPLPLDEAALNELRAELAAASCIGAALDETEQAAPEALEAADLALDISSDVDAALIDAFLHDSPPQAAEVTQSLQGWIADPTQTELLRNAKRAAHTLKGSANILGIRGVAKLAHRLEDILEICEAESAPPSSHARAGAHVRGRLPRADGGRGRRRRLARPTTRSPSSNCSTPRATTTRRTPCASARWTRRPSPLAAMPTPDRARTARAEAKATTRVPTELLDNLVRMVGEITIKIGELDQELKSAAGHSRELIEQRPRHPEAAVRAREFRRHPRRRRAPQAARGADARTPDFDSLEMDQYNEVQSLTRALIEETTDARDLGVGLKDELAGLAGILHQQQRLMRELQHLTSQTRMAPVETIVPRLQRNVRQTAAATHKQASLVIVGSDILVDADVLNQLIDPLLHILRNAVDHGLETPDERAAARQAARRHDHADRGAPRPGRHRAGRRRRPRPQSRTTSAAKAVERGLLDADATPTDAEIARLTLLPGFSTRDAVTEISGRGVGLDVVATRLRALSGSIDIRSESGRGLTIELRFQASLVATHALFVRDGGQVFGIASHAVRRAVPAVAVRARRARTARCSRCVDDATIPGARARHAHRPARRVRLPSAATSCWSTANPAPSACWSTPCSTPANSSPAPPAAISNAFPASPASASPATAA